MKLIMGIDTGGTFTDGVIVDPAAKKVICKSKVFTAKHNLVSSIDECITNLKSCNAEKVSMVCLSTTLATNAIVEGKRGRVALLLIGSEPKGQLPADICIKIRGKLNIKGRETEGIDEEEVLRSIDSFKDHVDAVAISGYASIRNPEHELRVKRILAGNVNLPIVCAHELSSQLGYYDRTVTASLNAGLIPIIGGLVRAVKTVLNKKSIHAPVMIVKGDGSLMQESFAMDKPIETILSGPAASMVGAVYLTNQKDAFVLDMGGTTTDTAIVSDGIVAIKNSGAVVGGWSPQIRAADIKTFGLGGDSRISISPEGKIGIGPRKVLPLCAAGEKYPNLLQELQSIKVNIESGEPLTGADCFSLIKVPSNIQLSTLEEKVVDILKQEAHSLFQIAETLGKNPEELDLERLEVNDIVQRISLTPTDIIHISGGLRLWDDKISHAGAEILAKQLKKTDTEFIDIVTSEITDQLFAACCCSVPGNKTFIRERPLIAIGAPVRAWMPAVSEKLQASLVIPEHAEVANAIGAAVGLIIESVEVLIRPEKKSNKYIMHAPWEYRQFGTLAEAVDYSIPAAKNHAYKSAESAGGRDIELTVLNEDIYIDNYDNSLKNYIETRIRVIATGKPK